MEIEKTKSDDDPRMTLANAWAKYKTDMNAIFYKVYWGEELTKVIREVAFIHSNPATFRTSAMGLSMMLLMSWTQDQHLDMDSELVSVWCQPNFGPLGIFYHSKTGTKPKLGHGSL